MARKKNEDNNVYNERMYEDLSEVELKNKVVRLWKEIRSMEAEKKEYVKSVGDTIKDLKEQIDCVVHWIDVKDTVLEKKILVEAATKALEEG